MVHKNQFALSSCANYIKEAATDKLNGTICSLDRVGLAPTIPLCGKTRSLEWSL